MPSGGEQSHDPRDLRAQVDVLSSNMSTLHSRMLDQSHMLNRLQSVVLSLTQEGTPAKDSTDQNQTFHNDQRIPWDTSNEQSLETVRQEVNGLRGKTVTLDANVTQLRTTVLHLSNEVEVLKESLRSFQTFVDSTTHTVGTIKTELNEQRQSGLLCSKKGENLSVVFSKDTMCHHITFRARGPRT